MKQLKEFWEQSEYKDSEQSLRSWYTEVKKAKWSNPHQVKKAYGTASIIGNDRVVFNICGNKYRLVIALKYDFHIGYIRFVGTHKQYNAIDAKEI